MTLTADFLQTVFAEMHCDEIGPGFSGGSRYKVAFCANKLYYVTDAGIFCCDFSLRERRQLIAAEDITHIFISQDRLYWITETQSGLLQQRRLYTADAAMHPVLLLNLSDQERAFPDIYPSAILENDDYLLLHSIANVPIAWNKSTGELSGFPAPFESISVTSDGQFIGREHHGTWNLWVLDPASGSQALLRGSENRESASAPLYVNVLAVGDSVYYSTRRPYAVWRLGADGQDEKLLDLQENACDFELFRGSDCLYLFAYRAQWLQASADRPDDENTVWIYKLSLPDGRIVDSIALDDISYSYGVQIVGDVLVYGGPDGLMMRNLFS